MRLLLPLLAALALPASASAATVTVNPGDDVDAKVDSANPGDTVLLKAGAHSGIVSVSDATVTIAGEPGTILANPANTTDPTITFSAAGGTVSDIAVVSTGGTGVSFTGGGDAKVLRSTVVTTASNGTAVTTVAGVESTAARTLTVDSSVLVGKTALSGSNSSVLGAMTVAARHITAIGALTMTKPNPLAAAATMSVVDSIVRGTVGTDVTAATDRNSVAANASDAASLFVRPASFNFHLRADAPVIDKGQVTSGESTTDIDGQARSNGAASDYGADEFHNRAPVAKIAAPSGAVRQGMAATFSAAESADPDVGGGVASYTWNFGDGSAEQTTTAPTVEHAFPQRQGYTVTVRVTDKQGGVSEAASVAVNVLDGTAPTADIGQPAAKQRLNLRRKSGKRQRVLLYGTASDDTAMKGVVLGLRKAGAKNGQCSWYDGKKRLKKSACDAPLTFAAKFANGQWRFSIPASAKIPKGPYVLYVVPVDASGLSGTAKTVSFRFR